MAETKCAVWRRDVCGHVEIARRVPSSAVHQQHRVSARRDAAGNFLDVLLHRFSVGVRHRDRRAFSARQADGAEELGVLVALVGGLARARALARPLAHI